MAEITFSDILIRPQYSEITSRSKVDISSVLDKIHLDLPLMAANMPQICGWKMCIEMFINGGMGILHRFCTIEDAVKEFNMAYKGIIATGKVKTDPSLCLGVSIGVKDEDKIRFEKLYEAGARVIALDVAHAHSILTKNTLQWLSLNKDIVIIAGNIATKEAAYDVTAWGASILKCGIGGGKVCRTRSNTGIGICQLESIMEVSKIAKIPLISDGAIKTAGDVSKALIFCDACMIGAVLAGTSETPGVSFSEPNTDLTNRTYYKLYGGNASQETKIANGQSGRFVEGETIKVPFKGHCKYLLREIADGLRSTLSYSNASNLQEYRQRVKWSVIGSGGKEESKF